MSVVGVLPVAQSKSGQEPNIERYAFALVTSHGDRTDRALHFTDTTTHTSFPSANDGIVVESHRLEGARIYAVAAIRASIGVNLRNVPRAGHHGYAALHHFPDATAAALAAVADGVEPVQHRVLKPSRVDVPTLMLGLQQVQRFLARQPVRRLRPVLKNKVGKRTADHHADPCGLTMCGAAMAADALVGDDVRWRLQHEVSGGVVGDNLVQIALGCTSRQLER
jgi:hypothetical protein